MTCVAPPPPSPEKLRCDRRYSALADLNRAGVIRVMSCRFEISRLYSQVCGHVHGMAFVCRAGEGRVGTCLSASGPRRAASEVWKTNSALLILLPSHHHDWRGRGAAWKRPWRLRLTGELRERPDHLSIESELNIDVRSQFGKHLRSAVVSTQDFLVLALCSNSTRSRCCCHRCLGNRRISVVRTTPM